MASSACTAGFVTVPGGSIWGITVTVLESTEDPTSLRALTEKSYAMPLVSPVNVQVRVPAAVTHGVGVLVPSGATAVTV